MEDHYEINIAKKDSSGRAQHWAKVIVSNNGAAAEGKLEYLRELFGDEFKITMTHWESRGIVKPEWE